VGSALVKVMAAAAQQHGGEDGAIAAAAGAFCAQLRAGLDR
jgi:hypothetical protein